MGCGVGWTVGAGVGWTVGAGVGWTVGGPGVSAGVGWTVGPGVGTTATSGGSDATGVAKGSDAIGDARGPVDGLSDGAVEGPRAVGVGSTVGPAEPVPGLAGVCDGATAIGPVDGEAVWPPPATPPGLRLGATTPAVSAAVARMRFRSPMATTRRAR